MLVDALRHHRHAHGVLGVDDFMAMVGSHYYATRAAIGEYGDFITAPAMGQLFGEALAVWIIQQWQALKQPLTWHLIELGAGYGDLLSDIARVLSRYPAMLHGLHYHSVETSPLLRLRQTERWQGLPVTWHKSMDTLPEGAPLLVIANEFLDALPVRQAVRHSNIWHKRIIIEKDNRFSFATGEALPLSLDAPEGSILEDSPSRDAVIKALSQRLYQQKGAAVFIDYGYSQSGFGDTLQALYQHRRVDVFEHLGDADITAHVDFSRAMTLARAAGLSTRLLSQASFLQQYGLRERLARLSQHATADQQGQLLRQYQRLTALDGMGTLFKVLEILHG